MLVDRNEESVTVEAFFLRKPRENLRVLTDVNISKIQVICYVLWMVRLLQQWDVKAIGSEKLASLLDASFLAQSTESLSPSPWNSHSCAHGSQLLRESLTYLNIHSPDKQWNKCSQFHNSVEPANWSILPTLPFHIQGLRKSSWSGSNRKESGRASRARRAGRCCRQAGGWQRGAVQRRKQTESRLACQQWGKLHWR